MNKFIILALAAFVSGALAAPAEIQDEASQFAFFEADDVETGSLSADRQMFADFCLQARDEVKSHVKSNANTGASVLFKGVSQHILDSAAKISEDTKKAAASGEQMIKEDAKNAKLATGGVLEAVINGIKSGFTEKLEQLTSHFTKDNIRSQIYSGCDDILEQIRPTLESKLEETKSELAQAASDDAVKSVIESTNLENVGCIMTGRVSKLSRSCATLKKIPQETLAGIGL